MSDQDWQPASGTTALASRAALLRQVRRFFEDRQVLEVETPVLSAFTGTDPALDPVRASLASPGGDTACFLQTSPEFAMKRLLASGSGPIYQLARSFRNGEAGTHHNPEFTLLEWYRPGYCLTDLMAEVESLLSEVLGMGSAAHCTYRDLFVGHLDLDPLAASLETLQSLAAEQLDVSMTSDNPDHWLDLLFSHCIQPRLQDPVFISHYPPSQAALAQLHTDADGITTALRFELVIRGIELANGYEELTDPQEQRRRFASDQEQRRRQDLPVYPVDERFLAALEHGLPDCSGVALGFDRLLMLKTGAASIREVMPFPVDIA